MEQGFSCSTSALQNTDVLEGISPKKTDVICNSLPLGCGPGLLFPPFPPKRSSQKKMEEFWEEF